MKKIDLLLSPPVVFLLMLGAAALLYALGRAMGPKLNKAGGKLTTYACGEDIPGTKVQFGYRLFFFIALFFTIMHVAALVVATAPAGKVLLLAIFYLVVIFLAIMALVTRD
jgi:NADH:ubiquinone oxidoreductase subunit 3 (subunit A)